MTSDVETINPPSLTQQNHDTLNRIRTHLDDQEIKIQEQLHRFQCIKRYVSGKRWRDGLARHRLIESLFHPIIQGHRPHLQK